MDIDLTALLDCLQRFPFIKEGWLFGSYVYGTPNGHSDIDLCVVIEDGSFSNANYGTVHFAIAESTGFKHDIDLVMVEQSVAYRHGNYNDLVYYDIFKRGKRIYSEEPPGN